MPSSAQGTGLKEVRFGLFKTKPTKKYRNNYSTWDDFEWFVEHGRNILDYKIVKVEVWEISGRLKMRMTYGGRKDPKLTITLPVRVCDDVSDESAFETLTLSELIVRSKIWELRLGRNEYITRLDEIFASGTCSSKKDRCALSFGTNARTVRFGRRPQQACEAMSRLATESGFGVAGFWWIDGYSKGELGLYVRRTTPKTWEPCLHSLCLGGFKARVHALMLSQKRAQRSDPIGDGVLGALPRDIILEIVRKLHEMEVKEARAQPAPDVVWRQDALKFYPELMVEAAGRGAPSARRELRSMTK